MTLPIMSALAASGYVGAWETDLNAQTVELTGTLPRLLAIDEAQAEAGVPLSDFVGGVHPDDRAYVRRLVDEAHATKGRFDTEFRTCDKAGATHWVMARGRVETGEEGVGARCIGIVADITASRAFDAASADQAVRAIARIADTLIDLRPLAQGLDSPVLRTLIDAMLFELGRLLAGHEAGSHATQSH